MNCVHLLTPGVKRARKSFGSDADAARHKYHIYHNGAKSHKNATAFFLFHFSLYGFLKDMSIPAPYSSTYFYMHGDQPWQDAWKKQLRLEMLG